MGQDVSRFVTPKVYLTGYTEAYMPGIKQFLEESGNAAFLADIAEAESQGLHGAEILCSMFAKMCYRALDPKHNVNLQRTRSIKHNIIGTLDSAHMSVFEHASLNFVVDDCSRVFTHELVRHRVGTAFSQTSGRYCRLEQINVVWDPVLDPVKSLWNSHLETVEDLVYLTECKLGLRKPSHASAEMKLSPEETVKCRREHPMLEWVPDDQFDFTKRKQITSAIRRIAPNGQDNEIGVTLNIRTLRHTLLLRTARFAEWEIRKVFEQIYHISKQRYPLLFCDAKETMVDGIVEVSGMKCQPYELSAKAVLDQMSDEEVLYFLKTRPGVVNGLQAV